MGVGDWVGDWGTHGALPREVVLVDAAPVQRDEKVPAAVPVGERELGLAHLLAGRPCWLSAFPSSCLRRFGALAPGGAMARGRKVEGEVRTPGLIGVGGGHDGGVVGLNWVGASGRRGAGSRVKQLTMRWIGEFVVWLGS